MIEKTTNTFWATIEIAGDINVAKQICREFCWEGCCVNLKPVDYIYTGGQESGVSITFVNYPRFPKTDDEIVNQAKRLAIKLKDGLCQWSYMIITPNETIWATDREERENG